MSDDMLYIDTHITYSYSADLCMCVCEKDWNGTGMHYCSCWYWSPTKSSWKLWKTGWARAAKAFETVAFPSQSHGSGGWWTSTSGWETRFGQASQEQLGWQWCENLQEWRSVGFQTNEPGEAEATSGEIEYERIDELIYFFCFASLLLPCNSWSFLDGKGRWIWFVTLVLRWKRRIHTESQTNHQAYVSWSELENFTNSFLKFLEVFLSHPIAKQPKITRSFCLHMVPPDNPGVNAVWKPNVQKRVLLQ